MAETIIDSEPSGWGGARFKARDDDARGGLTHGRNYVPLHPDPAMAEKLELLSKVCTIPQAAQLLGISESTIYRHYLEDWHRGRAHTTAAIGSMLIRQALEGDRASQFFYLRTQGGWTTKTAALVATVPGSHRLPGPDMDGAIDLSGLSDEQLEQYGRLCEAIGHDTPAIDGSLSSGEGEA